MRICDAPGGAVVEREPEFGMTSEILWVTSSQIPFLEVQIRSSLDIILLGFSILGRPNSIFPKRNLRWRNSEDFWRHPKFRFTFNYCTPRCITDSQKGYSLICNYFEINKFSSSIYFILRMLTILKLITEKVQEPD